MRLDGGRLSPLIDRTAYQGQLLQVHILCLVSLELEPLLHLRLLSLEVLSHLHCDLLANGALERHAAGLRHLQLLLEREDLLA